MASDGSSLLSCLSEWRFLVAQTVILTLPGRPILVGTERITAVINLGGTTGTSSRPIADGRVFFISHKEFETASSETLW